MENVKHIYRSAARDVSQERKRAFHDAQQNNEESWKGSYDEINKTTDMLRIKSFNFYSVHSILVTKLQASSS